MATFTVRTIHAQLMAQGLAPYGLRFVAWDADTLKVSRGSSGVLIHYAAGRDLYDLEEYHGLEVRPLAEGVYADGLIQAILPALGRREFEPAPAALEDFTPSCLTKQSAKI